MDVGRNIRTTNPNLQWAMETMPQARVAGNMVLLLNGDILIINSRTARMATWEYCRPGHPPARRTSKKISFHGAS
ncbi:hypothetical protein EUGRSUZ_F01107 [Eucalyptus grandis]|uniref:Uncharacterized protein n=2 Tax=Eucalyptus grandis TaxID=71139 RepID=A0ACC3KDL6_EUCGR|nr:hypothetical protein EUGRSUZ_F01107 [Eucalyptus grandis]